MQSNLNIIPSLEELRDGIKKGWNDLMQRGFEFNNPGAAGKPIMNRPPVVRWLSHFPLSPLLGFTISSQVTLLSLSVYVHVYVYVCACVCVYLYPPPILSCPLSLPPACTRIILYHNQHIPRPLLLNKTLSKPLNDQEDKMG